MFEEFLARKLRGWSGPVQLVFRVATSLIFIVGGLGHFFRSGEMLDRLRASPWLPFVESLGDPLLHLYLSGAVFVIAGLFLAVGFTTRLSALALFLVLIPVTVTIHVVPDSSHVGPLFKNVAILGALMFFFVHGGGWGAVDRQSAAKSG